MISPIMSVGKAVRGGYRVVKESPDREDCWGFRT